MAGNVFKTLNTSDQDLSRVQSNISDALNNLTGPFIGGVLMTGVSVGSSDTIINHKLGRQPEVWVVCDQDTLTNVKRSAWSTTSITLQAGSACTVSLWLN